MLLSELKKQIRNYDEKKLSTEQLLDEDDVTIQALKAFVSHLT